MHRPPCAAELVTDSDVELGHPASSCPATSAAGVLSALSLVNEGLEYGFQPAS